MDWGISTKPSLSYINEWYWKWSTDVSRTLWSHFCMANMSLKSHKDIHIHTKDLHYGIRLGSFDYTKL